MACFCCLNSQDVETQYEWGVRYMQSAQKEKNFIKRKKTYKKAIKCFVAPASQGHADAIYRIGWIAKYAFVRLKTAKNQPNYDIIHFQAAADRGHQGAQQELAKRQQWLSDEKTKYREAVASRKYEDELDKEDPTRPLLRKLDQMEKDQKQAEMDAFQKEKEQRATDLQQQARLEGELKNVNWNLQILKNHMPFIK